MRVLVTGAGGFVGREFLAGARRGDAELIAVVRGPVPDWGRGMDGLTWVEVDLCDLGFQKRLPERADAIVHLAQSRHYRDFPDGALDVVDVNLTATARLLDYARGASVSRFVFASTATVYRPSHQPLAENAPLAQPSLYAVSKRAAELIMHPYCDLFGCRALRIFTSYGPAQRRMLIAELIGRVRSGEAVIVDGGDGVKLSPIHVHDLCAALWAAAASDPPAAGSVDVVNVGGPDAIGIREIAKAIGAVVGRDPRLEYTGLEQPPGWTVDRSTFVSRFPDLEPPISFAEGIARTVTEQSSELIEG